MFAVTAGLGIEKKEAEFERALDDYSSIMLKSLADRLAEGFAECLHARVRQDLWGYAPDEALSNDDMIAEKYVGIRPAPGYPACPEHVVKTDMFRVLDGEDIGMMLTDSYAMYPASSVSGFYFSHPQSQYFNVGVIGEDQLEDYARRSAAASRTCAARWRRTWAERPRRASFSRRRRQPAQHGLQRQADGQHLAVLAGQAVDLQAHRQACRRQARRDAEAGQAGVAAGVRVADQAHEVLDAAGPRVGRDRQHGQRGEQQRVQAMAGEGVPVGGDQRVAVRGQGGFVQRRHRRRRAVRAGQGHRHDHAVEEALHIRAGDGRHHLRDIHAGFIAFQVRGQIGLRLVQADRHADGRVGLGQSRRLQRDEFHAGGALVQRGPRDAFHFRFQPGPETRRQAQPQAGDGSVCAGWSSPARIASSSAMSSMLAASGPGVSRVCEIGVMPAPS